jgi:hypothetical protein
MWMPTKESREALTSFSPSTIMPNLERAAQLLKDLPALWQHPGVTNKQRESLIQDTAVQNNPQ